MCRTSLPFSFVVDLAFDAFSLSGVLSIRGFSPNLSANALKPSGKKRIAHIVLPLLFLSLCMSPFLPSFLPPFLLKLLSVEIDWVRLIG